MLAVLLRHAGVLLLLMANAAFAAVPGRLPLHLFSAADGLAADSVVGIFRDSRGYLWLSTIDGLSRYDGRRFVSYSTDDGLPHRRVGDMVEDRHGALWIGTAGGVVRMDPDAPVGRPFTRVPAPKMSYPFMPTVFIDRRGVPWAACGLDLCVYERDHFVVDGSFRAGGGKGEVLSIVDTSAGEMWVGTRHGVMHRTAKGVWRHYDIDPRVDTDDTDVVFDREGRMWITTPIQTFVLASPDDLDDDALARREHKVYLPGMTYAFPERGQVISFRAPWQWPVIHLIRPFWARDGAVWIGTGLGLLRLKEGRFDHFDDRAGLPRIGITAVGEDAAGNLWIGCGYGVLRLTTRGAITITRDNGLSDDRITSIVETEKELCVTNAVGISCVNHDGVVHNAPASPGSVHYAGWGWNQVAVHDARKQWWVATGEGLVQWPPAETLDQLKGAKARIYTKSDGLASSDLFRVWQDSKGDLWIGGFGKHSLTRRDAATGRFTVYRDFPVSAPTAFAEDRAGNVWVGLYDGSLMRHRNGRFERVDEGLPKGFVRDVHVDKKGRLWMATSGGGVARVDDPTATRITAILYTRAKGLASDVSRCLAETADGRIAIGSIRGLDLLDPETGRISHLTTADGLPSNEIVVAHSDRFGTLWLGTQRGVARLSLIPDGRSHPPEQPRILSVAINGVPARMPALGTVARAGLRLQYPQRRMAITFGAPHFDLAQPIRFEYRLGDDPQWTAAGAVREAVYDRLPFGKQTFEVRTVNSAGVSSPVSRVTFDVIAPYWLRPWFLVVASMIVIGVFIVIHRYRVAHVLALERLRRRVATDLHDDLGSSLSRISILSEVAKESADQRLLDEIGDTARDLVDALGDSIWSVDPQRDDVQSLLSRVRHFAADLLEAKSMVLEFRVAPDLASIPLDPERRRELYLILKEALNNTAKHSDARRVVVAGDVEHGHLRIMVEDDGKGFALLPAEQGENGGRGVTNMSERARRVGGTVSVVSEPGVGTRVSVAVPV